MVGCALYQAALPLCTASNRLQALEPSDLTRLRMHELMFDSAHYIILHVLEMERLYLIVTSQA